MNEPFEDLMYKAGLTAQGCWDKMDSYDRKAIEKFAELIVKECITAVENTDRTHAYTTFDKQLIDATIIKSVQSINKHFK